MCPSLVFQFPAAVISVDPGDIRIGQYCRHIARLADSQLPDGHRSTDLPQKSFRIRNVNASSIIFSQRNGISADCQSDILYLKSLVPDNISPDIRTMRSVLAVSQKGILQPYIRGPADAVALHRGDNIVISVDMPFILYVKKKDNCNEHCCRQQDSGQKSQLMPGDFILIIFLLPLPFLFLLHVASDICHDTSGILGALLFFQLYHTFPIVVEIFFHQP